MKAEAIDFLIVARYKVGRFITRARDVAVDVGRRVRESAFNVYVAVNMLICSILFVGQSYPRETLSGFIGRRALMGSSFFLHIAKAIDKLYRNEPAHCGETALAEDNMRCELYPELQEAQVADLPSRQPDDELSAFRRNI